MVRLALACARHRRAVLAIWVLILIGLSMLSKALPAQYANNITLPGTESHAAAQILDKQFTNQSGDRSQIVFAVDSGTLNNQATQARATKMLADVAKLPHLRFRALGRPTDAGRSPRTTRLPSRLSPLTSSPKSSQYRISSGSFRPQRKLGATACRWSSVALLFRGLNGPSQH